MADDKPRSVGQSKWARVRIAHESRELDEARKLAFGNANRASWKTYRGTVHVLISAKDKRAARAALRGIGPDLATKTGIDASVLEIDREGLEEI